MNILITGGLGFIGSAVVRALFRKTEHNILVVDAFTYAAQPEALEEAGCATRVEIVKCDILDGAALKELFSRFQPDKIIHLAAESHVDRSLDQPSEFMTTNIMGTFALLQVALGYFESLSTEIQKDFRFLHVSTDEVFGSLDIDEPPFCETTPYDPRSPYSASKAASDHLVSAWHHSYGLPTIITNCSNNYGPWQNKEKLIPLMITNAFFKKALPIYGDGKNRRDWLHVEDHAAALIELASFAAPGSNYVIGGNQEYSNLDVVDMICEVMNTMYPGRPRHQELITFVDDRLGHDFRYAIEPSKFMKEFTWEPRKKFEDGLRGTVKWYLKQIDPA